MKTYEAILGEVADTVAKRDGKTPEEIAKKYGLAAQEGHFRDAVCQILADEKPKDRKKFLDKYPELRRYYPLRIRTMNKQ